MTVRTIAMTLAFVSGCVVPSTYLPFDGSVAADGSGDAGVDAAHDVSGDTSLPSMDVGFDASLPPTDTGVDVPPSPVDTGVDVSPPPVDARLPPTTPSCPIPTERGCGSVTIPGGSFTMGGDTAAYSDTPSQPITVSGFTMDAYEVTVARFRRFWFASPTRHPPVTGTIAYPGGTVTWGGPVAEPYLAASDPDTTWSETAGSLEAHPINDVDWYTAQAFCVWDGGRLPTEAEWEYAARGWTAGGSLTAERVYPWGTPDPSTTCDRAQWNTCTGDDGNPTKQVGSFPSGASGDLYDLAGNVWEWNADWYAAYTDTTCWNGTNRTNPICNNSANGTRVNRGGSSFSNDVANLRSASRLFDTPVVRSSDIGFRCARTP